MKVFVLFVLVFCVQSSFQQLNRQQMGQTQSLSYSESDFHPLPPVARTTTTTTTTEAPETTTKKKGFFSGFTGFFKSKDKEESTTTTTTTTTPRPTSTVKPVASVTTTVKSTSAASASTAKSVSGNVPPAANTTPKVPPRNDLPTTPPRPAVPPRSDVPTPPPRTAFPPPVSTTVAPKKKEDFPPLPTQTDNRPSTPPPTAGPGIPNAWGLPPQGPTPKPQSFFPQITTSTRKTPQFSTAAPSSAASVVSGGPVTDAELLTLSESLFSKDIHNPFKYVTVNYQGRTQSSQTSDEAPQPLLKIDDKLFQLNTVEKMMAMYNNYEQDTAINEYVSPNERKEEDEFLDAVQATPVMRHAMNFLQQKGSVTPDPQTHRELLRTIWFNLYSRGMGKIGSSGFEHVFLSEVRNGTVMGLHNWIYLSEEEKTGDLDYKGWTKKIDLGNKGQIAKVRFTLNQLNKPSNSLFIGTSPELELALYTVCFELRADKDCRLAYGGKDFNIVTHSFRYRGKNLIGSAYPEI